MSLAASLSAMTPSELSELPPLVAEFVPEIAAAAATSASAFSGSLAQMSTALNAASQAVSSIPFAGTVAAIIGAAGNQAASADKVSASHCVTEAVTPLPSGPNGDFRPCDLFVRPFKAGAPTGPMPAFGEYLALGTETVAIATHNAAFGLPGKRRAAYYALRTAIQADILHKSGGAELFAIWAGMLSADVDAGRLDATTMRALAIAQATLDPSPTSGPWVGRWDNLSSKLCATLSMAYHEAQTTGPVVFPPFGELREEYLEEYGSLRLPCDAFVDRTDQLNSMLTQWGWSAVWEAKKPKGKFGKTSSASKHTTATVKDLETAAASAAKRKRLGASLATAVVAGTAAPYAIPWILKRVAKW